ncbi:MAG: hypothetical protein LC632_05350 [Xanthomonadaceae bacterium]|nr:hypothetical protein [Xanthomonadaceae bacterium]
MKTWQIEVERWLSDTGAPGALDRGLVERVANRARNGSIPASTLSHWIAGAVRRGKLQPVIRGVWLNGFRGAPGRLPDAAQLLRRDAVVSLNTVLGDCGALNNPSAIVTAIVPLDRGPVKPVVGRQQTAAGTFHFFAMPREVLEAGEDADRYDPEVTDHVRATPERALVDWLYLAASTRSRRVAPNSGDLDMAFLDLRRLERLAKAVKVEDPLRLYLAAPHAQRARRP